VGIAIVLGSLVPVPPLALLGIGLVGNPIMPAPLTVYFAIVAGAAALGIVSLAVSTRVGLRARPIDAIGLRE
jgi:putative ABC transport system permease protein